MFRTFSFDVFFRENRIESQETEMSLNEEWVVLTCSQSHIHCIHSYRDPYTRTQTLLHTLKPQQHGVGDENISSDVSFGVHQNNWKVNPSTLQFCCNRLNLNNNEFFSFQCILDSVWRKEVTKCMFCTFAAWWPQKLDTNTKLCGTIHI